MHLSCTDIEHCLQMERREIPHDPRHLGVLLGTFKIISEPMVRSTQTVHYLASRLALSPNGLSFHLSLLTSEYHQVHPKRFVSRWYIWSKLYTYLAPTLTLSLNGKKRSSTWPTSPRSSMGAPKMIFEPMVLSTQTVHLSCINISTISERTKTSFYMSFVT
jgi:hypothetical protein